MKAANQIGEISMFEYESARVWLREFVTVEGSWEQYIAECLAILDALTFAYTLAPNDVTIICSIIRICAENLRGYKYEDPYDGVGEIARRKVKYVDSKCEDVLKKCMADFVKEMTNIDSNYRAPDVTKLTVGWRNLFLSFYALLKLFVER